MLEDKFEGGDVYLENELQDFKKRGDVIFFNGGKQLHEVKEITKGKRKILSIWTKPSSVM
jgi:predicted 2-oxoglutarate/Fe(II)-dependent dioxygenase YbiX